MGRGATGNRTGHLVPIPTQPLQIPTPFRMGQVVNNIGSMQNDYCLDCGVRAYIEMLATLKEIGSETRKLRLSIVFVGQILELKFQSQFPEFQYFQSLQIGATSFAQTDETTTFSFNSFRRGDPLIELQGNARILSNGDVQLAEPLSNGNSGRVLYSRPVRLWDRTTGNVATFITSFSFTMRDVQGFTPADGIMFFIAPENIRFTSQQGTGGALGIAQSNGRGQFVGVEFDNSRNTEFNDPRFDHIGIDVNSVISTRTTQWGRVSGTVVKVTVAYDSSSKVLSAIALNGNGDITTISQVVDLRRGANLPERVKFGISSATGLGRQVHLIRSWSFTSTLRSGSQTMTTTSNNGTNIEHVPEI
ncbi:hypothetical protein PIB30_001937 [Stylosanthes scabra]|uniref:Legume lectin domain-containing protein n=1 Tax=Stylosanthes scabra TaxID=79078 RepID=A0ABU6Y136_9FABA|nr:hypothetical protein [Stylosanthes scabra]